MPYDTGITFSVCSNLVIALQHYVTMNTNLKNPQSSSPVKAQLTAFTDSFDFECWAREVRTQLLAALQKKAANSPQIEANKLKKAKSLGSD